MHNCLEVVCLPLNLLPIQYISSSSSLEQSVPCIIDNKWRRVNGFQLKKTFSIEYINLSLKENS